MVKLRLARYGKRGQPFYRIVAIDDRKKREGPALEVVGTYNPLTKPATIILKKERIEYWLKMGAQMTETVRNLTKGKTTKK